MSDKKPETQMSGTVTGYRVQARVSRFNATNPVRYSQPHYPNQPLYLTEKWADIHFTESLNPACVPQSTELFVRAAYLMDKKSAIAFAYTFAAQLGDYRDVEIRLRKYEAKYSMEYGPIDEIIPLTEHLSDFEKSINKFHSEGEK